MNERRVLHDDDVWLAVECWDSELYSGWQAQKKSTLSGSCAACCVRRAVSRQETAVRQASTGDRLARGPVGICNHHARSLAGAVLTAAAGTA